MRAYLSLIPAGLSPCCATKEQGAQSFWGRSEVRLLLRLFLLYIYRWRTPFPRQKSHWSNKALFVKNHYIMETYEQERIKKNPCEIFRAPPYVNRSVTPVFVHSSSSRWTRVVCGGRNSWLISREHWKVINPGKSTAAMRAVPFCRIWLEISVKPLILFFKDYHW